MRWFSAHLAVAFVVAAASPATAAVDAGGDGAPSPAPPPEQVDAGALEGGGVMPMPAPAVTDAQPAPPPTAEPVMDVTVVGRRRKLERGGSDFHIDVGKLGVFANRNAQELLQLAPGIFLANEGGEGHAEQVFLRGFDAESGQAVEFTVGGVPVNEVNNPDGHGYADTHFVIPELVRELRVIEGPFDPHQGDFAVAGSAEYELGVPRRGLRFEVWRGSFDSQRLLALWAPAGQRAGTFGAAQFWRSAGYGTNRANSNASAMAQYEGTLARGGSWRLLATSYATHYKSAGVVRQESAESGRIEYYGTEDPSQGGDAQRHSLSFDLDAPTAAGSLSQQLFVVYRTLRIVEDFTGFLHDDQDISESLHDQRGDAYDRTYEALTAGARGAYRLRGRWLGWEQSIEAGYYGRYDHAHPMSRHLRFGTFIPYKVEEDFVSDVFNVAGYVDLNLRPLRWLTLRGGLRQEYFHYDNLNACKTGGQYRRMSPLDVACPAYDRAGARLSDQRVTATAQVTEPKGTVLVQIHRDVTVTASYGLGAQSLGARYIGQDQDAPFAKLRAAEAGVLYRRRLARWDLGARLVGYDTHVDRDLVFDPALGRLAAADGTTRRGAVFAMRATGPFVDQLASLTYAHAVFDTNDKATTTSDAGGAAMAEAAGVGGANPLVPYVPELVARSYTVVGGRVPWWRPAGVPLGAELGLGLSLIGRRPLPYGQSTAPTYSVDLNGSLRWGMVQLGARVMNLTDHRYPLSQFYYASDFRTRDYPTLAPARHFTAAPPRTVFVTLALLLGEEEAP